MVSWFFNIASEQINSLTDYCNKANLLIYEIFAISIFKLNLSRYNITVAKTLGLSIKKAEQAEVNHKVLSQSQKGKMTPA